MVYDHYKRIQLFAIFLILEGKFLIQEYYSGLYISNNILETLSGLISIFVDLEIGEGNIHSKASCLFCKLLP